MNNNRGSYGQVKIMGNAWAREDIEAEKIKVLGSAEFRGLKAGEMKVKGSARFTGMLIVNTLEVAGSVDTSAIVRAQDIKIFGSLTAKEEVSTERFLAKGILELTSLNANDVTIELAETCHVGEIGAENVKVRPLSKFRLGFFGFNHNKNLRADTIEADYIELSNTAARIVKGNKVIIGPDCEIETVEYKDSLEINRNSIVKNKIKVG
ncbi:Integral membrane protein CcmA involved in cell shape determination [Candidatus Desulfosporosinus infrequens]|uniref:Integral membrane protein CcmA involved in cell shape determination n=1 Tax=Candidatus Desulfosporosinus infrequens TaxID=2043169 RepID=A0A2U3KQ63_9FIRM|nr:Integral membrane protein CcmA involved in cell shape determination [Candidatus Desulfosporosinus infrequens]